MNETRRMLSEPRADGGLSSPPFDALAELRLLMRRLLVAGGALVALSTLALDAALERPEAARGASLDQEPSFLVLGALGSAGCLRGGPLTPDSSSIADIPRPFLSRQRPPLPTCATTRGF